MTKYLAPLFLITMLLQGCSSRGTSAGGQNEVLNERMRTAKLSTYTLEGGKTITELRFAGSLKPNFMLPCISLEKITNNLNPPALAFAARRCMDQKNYKDSAALLTVGSAFAYYDLSRLADRSTYGAWKVLNMKMFGDLTKEQREAYTKVAKKLLDDPKQRQTYCKALTRIGPPSYTPLWAILHGIGAFLETDPRNGPYLANVNPEVVWQELITNRCSGKK